MIMLGHDEPFQAEHAEMHWDAWRTTTMKTVWRTRMLPSTKSYAKKYLFRSDTSHNLELLSKSSIAMKKIGSLSWQISQNAPDNGQNRHLERTCKR
jgi:hypothetical protein